MQEKNFNSAKSFQALHSSSWNSYNFINSKHRKKLSLPENGYYPCLEFQNLSEVTPTGI